MRWMKHFNDARDDARIQEGMDRFGRGFYATWFMLLERVAQEWDGKTGEPTLTLSKAAWTRALHFADWRSAAAQFRYMVDSNLIQSGTEPGFNPDSLRNGSVKNPRKRFTVTIPKLRELRDEWSRKNDQSLRSNSLSEAEAEVDKKERGASVGSVTYWGDEEAGFIPPSDRRTH